MAADSYNEASLSPFNPFDHMHVPPPPEQLLRGAYRRSDAATNDARGALQRGAAPITEDNILHKCSGPSSELIDLQDRSVDIALASMTNLEEDWMNGHKRGSVATQCTGDDGCAMTTTCTHMSTTSNACFVTVDGDDDSRGCSEAILKKKLAETALALRKEVEGRQRAEATAAELQGQLRRERAKSFELEKFTVNHDTLLEQELAALSRRVLQLEARLDAQTVNQTATAPTTAAKVHPTASKQPPNDSFALPSWPANVPCSHHSAQSAPCSLRRKGSCITSFRKIPSGQGYCSLSQQQPPLLSRKESQFVSLSDIPAFASTPSPSPTFSSGSPNALTLMRDTLDSTSVSPMQDRYGMSLTQSPLQEPHTSMADQSTADSFPVFPPMSGGVRRAQRGHSLGRSGGSCELTVAVAEEESQFCMGTWEKQVMHFLDSEASSGIPLATGMRSEQQPLTSTLASTHASTLAALPYMTRRKNTGQDVGPDGSVEFLCPQRAVQSRRSPPVGAQAPPGGVVWAIHRALGRFNFPCISGARPRFGSRGNHPKRVSVAAFSGCSPSFNEHNE